jgi:hypothetical protein
MSPPQPQQILLKVLHEFAEEDEGKELALIGF